MIRVLRDAVDTGITFFDTAEVYGPFVNEELVGKALQPVREDVVIASRFGWHMEGGKPFGFDSSPARIKRVADESLRRLQVEALDLFYQHRVDPDVPIEEVVRTVSELVTAGKVRPFGLSEAGPARSAQPTPCIQSPRPRHRKGRNSGPDRTRMAARPVALDRPDPRNPAPRTP